MRIHMVGVGGISMRALAEYLAAAGHQVTGCDLNQINLDKIPVSTGHNSSHIKQLDEVVISSAVTPRSLAWPEIEAAKQQGVRIRKRAQVIGDITRERKTLAISGTHGKSTTTGMLARIFIEARLDPLVMVGALMPELKDKTFRLGDGPLVLEADEFDRSFLEFLPTVAVLTNIEADHLDYYTGGLPEIRSTFKEFIQLVRPDGAVIVNGDDDNIKTILEDWNLKGSKLIRYGRETQNDYQIIESSLLEHQNSFTVLYKGERAKIELLVPGTHNQENAVAALVAADFWSIERDCALRALETFIGVGQRFEVLANSGGPVLVSDYGHHPTEVKKTIAAARAWEPSRKIVVAFQPHQYARTERLFDDFVSALSTADHAIVTDIFAVAGREEQHKVTAGDLARAIVALDGKRGEYIPVPELKQHLLSLAEPNDLILAIGAGRDIGRIAIELAAELNADGKVS